MKYLAIVVLAMGIGCSGPVPEEGVPVGRAFGEGRGFELRIRQEASPLSARRFVPVYSPPRIFAVYVPSRVSRERDLLIGEHWIFMKLDEGGWFSEREPEPPRPQERAGPDALRRLLRGIRGTRFDRVIRE